MENTLNPQKYLLPLSKGRGGEGGEATYCQTIAIQPKTADYALACCRDHGLMTELLALVDIGDMNLNDWTLKRTNAVVKSN